MGESDALIELGESDGSRGLVLDATGPSGCFRSPIIARDLEVGLPPLLHRRDST